MNVRNVDEDRLEEESFDLSKIPAYQSRHRKTHQTASPGKVALNKPTDVKILVE